MWPAFRDLTTCVAKDGANLNNWEVGLNLGEGDVWFSLLLLSLDRWDYDLVVRELTKLLIERFALLKEVIVQLYQPEIFDGEEEMCDEPPNYRVPRFATEG